MPRPSLPPRVANLLSTGILNWGSNNGILILRFLRLQSLAQIWNRYKRKVESPKIALHHSRIIATLAVLIHITPFSAVVSLLVLNIKTVDFGHVPTQTLTALQFLAKWLEILVQASLATIALETIRSQLLGSSPLPLGAVFTPYRIADVSYLWSLEFWSSTRATYLSKWYRFVLCLTIGLCILLAALVGPAGAIAILPRSLQVVDWRELIAFDPTLDLFPTNARLVSGQVSNLQDVQSSFSQLEANFVTDGYGSRATNRINPAKSFKQMRSVIAAQSAFSALQYSFKHGGWPNGKVTLTGRSPVVSQQCFRTKVTNNTNSFVNFGPAFPTLNSLISGSEAFGNVTELASTKSGLDFVTTLYSDARWNWYSYNVTSGRPKLLLNRITPQVWDPVPTYVEPQYVDATLIGDIVKRSEVAESSTDGPAPPSYIYTFISVPNTDSTTQDWTSTFYLTATLTSTWTTAYIQPSATRTAVTTYETGGSTVTTTYDLVDAATTSYAALTETYTLSDQSSFTWPTPPATWVPVFDENNAYDVEACVIEAAWRESDLRFEDNVLSIDSIADVEQTSDIPIQIDADWAQALIVSIMGTDRDPNTYKNADIISLALAASVNLYWPCYAQGYLDGHSLYDGCGPSSRTWCGTHVPNIAPFTTWKDALQAESMLDDYTWISMIQAFQGDNGGCIVPNDLTANWTDPGLLAQFTIHHYAYGFGYDTDGIAVKLSLTVLAVYAAIVVIYLFCVVIVTGRTATSWHSIGELVALALNTQRPSHLQNTSVGVDLASTYAKPVNIRANMEGSAEIVFDDDPTVRRGTYVFLDENTRY